MADTPRKTEYLYVQGKCTYARVKNPDVEYDCWHITLYPDHVSLEKIRELQAEGMKNTIKKDDDGWLIKFRRPMSRKYRNKFGVEQVIPFDPPQVVNPDGTAFEGYIGNGSDVTLKLEVYQHGTPGGGKAKAARLLSVRVDHLVPYVPGTDGSEENKRQVEGLDKIEPIKNYF